MKEKTHVLREGDGSRVVSKGFLNSVDSRRRDSGFIEAGVRAWKEPGLWTMQSDVPGAML